MKNKMIENIHLLLMLYICISIVLSTTKTYSQSIVSGEKLQKYVLSSGAVQSTGTDIQIQGTIGQTIINVTKNSSNYICQGFWYFTPALPSGVDESFAMSESFDLHLTAFPNPFSTSTTISYRISNAMNVTLDVFDMTGKLVRRITNDFKHSGTYTSLWDGRDDSGKLLPAGYYFYGVQTEASARAHNNQTKNQQYKSMIIVR